jgi:TRAP-type transport system small permease protein
LASLRRIELWLLGLTLVVIVGCVLWGIVTRYVSPRPSPWTIEVASIAFCWSCLIGSGALYARGIHPRVFEPARLWIVSLRPFAQGISLLVELAVLVAVGYYGFRETLQQFDNPTSVLRLPVSVYYLPLVWFSLSSLLALGTRR